MRNFLWFFLSFFSAALALAQPTASEWRRFPFDDANWGNCDLDNETDDDWHTSISYLERNNDSESDLYGGYHAADDWNGGCGPNGDYGMPVYADADGKIVRIKRTLTGGGRMMFIEHILPTYHKDRDETDQVRLVKAYLHLSHIPSSLVVGMTVYVGEHIGDIGGSGNGRENGFIPHLHVETRVTEPYFNPITGSRDPIGSGDSTPSSYHWLWEDVLESPSTRKHMSPANLRSYTSNDVVAADRNEEFAIQLPQVYQWNTFVVPENQPSMTSYVSWNGNVLSLQDAINDGYIYGRIYYRDPSDGRFYYWPNPVDTFFYAGYTYYMAPLTSGVEFYLHHPDHDIFDRDDKVIRERAFVDIAYALRNAGSPFDGSDFKTETYRFIQDTGGYVYYRMYFRLIGQSLDYPVYIAIKKGNPYERYVNYWTGSGYSGWNWIDWNHFH